jgi:hypothetical protein
VSDWVPARVPPEAFVRTLWAEVERHPAVAHPFLCRFAEGGLARWQIGDYTSQYYQLVGSFTAYLEAMRGGRPIRRSAACCAASSRTSTCAPRRSSIPTRPCTGGSCAPSVSCR